MLRSLLFAAIVTCSAQSSAAENPFHIYFPSRDSGQVFTVVATPSAEGIDLAIDKGTALGFTGATITVHATLPMLYISGPGGNEGAAIALDAKGEIDTVQPVEFGHGYAYLSTDRSGKLLLGCSYRDGAVDVYQLNEVGAVGEQTATVNEGRKSAHCVLPSPDNRFVYIPYVKDQNALYQYAFDAKTGTLTALDPLDAGPTEPSGPRHLAYHPTLPIAYFSNEQRPGVSAYAMGEDGQLALRQTVAALPIDPSVEGLSSSDIAITSNGKFLFSGIRHGKGELDAIARYRLDEDGEVTHLGNTPAGDIPWGMALSPDGQYLIVTAFKGETLSAFKIDEKGELSLAGQIAIEPKVSDLVTR